MANSISNGASLFSDAFGATQAAAQGKEVWVTETGWPISGPAANQAEANTDNAKKYWDDVGCDILFGKTNTWWYTLQDAAPTTPSPSFGVVGSSLSTTPLYDLSCNASSSSSSSSSAAASGTASGGGAAATTVLPSAVATASGADGGSPGISAGAGSVVTVGGTAAGGAGGATATLPGTPTNPTGAGGSGSGGSGSGSSSGSGSGSGGSGSAGGNGTVGGGSGSSPSASTTAVITNAAPANLVSFGAAFIALLAASMIL